MLPHGKISFWLPSWEVAFVMVFSPTAVVLLQRGLPSSFLLEPFLSLRSGSVCRWSRAQPGWVDGTGEAMGRRGKPCEESTRLWKESEDGNVRKSLLSSYPICTAQCEVHSSALKSELDLMSHKHFSILLVIFNQKFVTDLSCIDI